MFFKVVVVGCVWWFCVFKLANLSSGWLILGCCCGFKIWDGADGFEICGCVDLSRFIFIFIILFFLRWRWWIWVCAGGGWSVLLLLVAVVVAMVDVSLLLLMVMIGRR